MNTNAAMDGKTIVQRWRRDYGTMEGLANEIDAALAHAAEAAAAQEREACVKLADTLHKHQCASCNLEDWESDRISGFNAGLAVYQKAIRARSQP